ncbi:MAG TPA: hypothetical protein ENK26_03420 [Gammaproteobacteria bacterium]|nr:hypothetical protein [Gammaproteobacteria bacterium]
MPHRQYDFREGDTGSTLQYTCRDQDGVIIDLTGASVDLIWVDKAGATQTRAMSIANPASSGVVSYQFAAAELVKGEMRFWVRVTDALGKIVHDTGLDPVSVGPVP